MLNDLFKKVKSWCQENSRDLFITGLIFLSSIASFGLGRLSVIWPQKQPIRITEGSARAQSIEDRGGDSAVPAADSRSPSKNTGAGTASQQGKFVASKSGSAYHYPWCPSALKIKEENKVWFETREEAEAKGYRPAANCPGL